MVFLILSTLLLTNYVVAIMRDKYAQLQGSRLGLYYDSLLGSLSAYKWDPHYGALISTPIPLNLVILLFSPLFIITKDPIKLRKINKVFTMIGYLPVALFLVAFYITANLLMLPFAYLAALAKKIQLLNSNSILDFLVFLAFGWLILLL